MSALTHHLPAGIGRGGERRSLGRRVRSLSLAIFFTSVAVNAALGIYAVLAPDFGETQSKILATSLCVTGAVIVALACEPAWERGLLGPVPYAGAILAAAGFALTVFAMWSEIDNEVYGKVVGTIMTAAAACTLASLLGLTRLAPRHRWVFVVALALLMLGATMFAIAPWLGDDPPDTYLRIMGVVSIVFAAFAVTVPVLHWVDRGVVTAMDVTAAEVRFCPYCGKGIAGEHGVSVVCGRCGAEFVVTANGTSPGRG